MADIEQLWINELRKKFSKHDFVNMMRFQWFQVFRFRKAQLHGHVPRLLGNLCHHHIMRLFHYLTSSACKGKGMVKLGIGKVW